jgi:hypothetical protein
VAELNQLEDALARAIDEIRELRHRNEILGAKVEMIDLFALVLHSEPRHRLSGAMHPDPLWLLQRAFDDLKAKKEPGLGDKSTWNDAKLAAEAILKDAAKGELTAQELGSAVRASGQVGKGISGR